MSNLVLIIFSLGIYVVSFYLTKLVYQVSINKNFLDIPNQRSSHDIPKPKGGGISIVVLLFLTIIVLIPIKLIDTDILLSLLIGGSIVSVIGFMDDIKSLPILSRAITYLLSTIISVYLINGIEQISINERVYELGYTGWILGILFIVWLTNLYNFMDGTDGFAAIQTICTSIFCGALLYQLNNTALCLVLFCMVFSTLGFLKWNWPPAKIFMGDVGSCTVGFIFGLLAIYTDQKDLIPLSVWLILLAPFIGDSTITLLKRLVNREKWYKAHNTHAYQKLYQLGISHTGLAISLFCLNIAILWPLAYLAYMYKKYDFFMVLIAYLIIGCVWLVVQYKHKLDIKITS